MRSWVCVLEGGQLPVRSTAHAAALDCFAREEVELPPGAVRPVPLGFALKLPPDRCAEVRGRSGLAKDGIWCHPGLVDADYQLEVKALLYNTTGSTYTVQAGSRACQLKWGQVEAMGEWPGATERTGGFGSTGSMGLSAPELPAWTSKVGSFAGAVLELWTDGSGRASGPGGWAYRIVGREGQVLSEQFGSEKETTSNRMEMTAVLEALRAVRPFAGMGVRFVVYSDSAYVVNCWLDKWYEGWQRNGWKNSSNKPVSNRDLWELLLAEAAIFGPELSWQHVPGHVGLEHNEAVDKLAGAYKRPKGGTLEQWSDVIIGRTSKER